MGIFSVWQLLFRFETCNSEMGKLLSIADYFVYKPRQVFFWTMFHYIKTDDTIERAIR